jgi:cbb3-type cytochrome oxidase subunit 3
MTGLALLRGLFTLTLLVLFVAMIATTFSKRRKGSYEAAARLALDDGDELRPEDLGK